MSDFTSDFWGVYVALLTIVSIAACGVLLWAVGRTRVAKAPGEAQGDTTGRKSKAASLTH